MTLSTLAADENGYAIRRSTECDSLGDRGRASAGFPPDLAGAIDGPPGTGALSLSVSGLSHSYGSKQVIGDISFDIPAGEVAALLGPSGCGKTTVLRAIAGLIRPRSGVVHLGGADLSLIPANARRIGVVFQSFALFPHFTVRQNIAYPLACQRVPRRDRNRRVEELVGLLRLEGLVERLPRELSGGQQQRVAVGRALAANPSLLLLDEPFGALDRALRLDLQVELLKLQRSLGITTLIITHDQEEAQTLASRLVLMNDGRVEQIGSPSEIYDAPVSLFASRFIGHSNQIAATVIDSRNTQSVLRLSTGERLVLPRKLDFSAGDHVELAVRPEHVFLCGEMLPGRLKVQSMVTLPLGPTLIHDIVLSDGTEVKATEARQSTEFHRPGDLPAYVELDLHRCNIFAS